MRLDLEEFNNEKNETIRNCCHWECPYHYCQHHNDWNGCEYDKLSFFQKNNIPNSDKEVEHCMSYMDI